MKGINMKRMVWLIVGLNLGISVVPAQQPDTAEIIKQLQKRVEELEEMLRPRRKSRLWTNK
jgi:hypothetical protein